MSFAGIYGHDGPKQVLQRAIASERVSHAYLFEGQAHVGKTMAAVGFAKALMCEAPPEPGGSCGDCAICKSVERGNHPDFLLLMPTSRLEIEDEEGQKAVADIEGSMISVEAVSWLISEANLRAAAARRKVFIVSSAEAMNPASANRLLKTLEEPPGRTTIILTAASTSALLPTIVSRCQLVRFGPVPTDQVEAMLKGRFPETDPALARSVAALSGGRPGWAVRLLEHPDTLEIRARILDLAAQLPTRPMLTCMKSAESLIDAAESWWLATAEGDYAQKVLKANRDRVLRTQIGELLDILLTWYRDLAVAGDGDSHGLLTNADRAEQLTGIARALPKEAPALAAGAIRRAKQSLGGNANLRMTVEVMLTDIWQAVVPVSQPLA